MLANPNGLHEPASLPHFSPPNHAVWVNALWFLSLVISLICALLATLLQQWARRYLKITRLRSSLHKRARIRAFFAEGVKNCLLPRVVDVLPTLLHISLFLFFAGLIIFLGNVDLTIFILVLSWVGFCAAVYWCITCMPIFRHDSPYYTPLSLLTWHIVTRALFFIYRFLRWCTWPVRSCYGAYSHFSLLEESCRKSLEWGMQKTAEETALNLPPGIDTRAFMWTFDCLDEDDGLERFFSGLPGFRSSRFVKDPLPSLTEEEKWRLSEGLRGLLDRTFSSDILQADVKDQRALICTKAIDQEHMLNAFILHAILFKYKHSGPVATEVARILRGRDYIHARDILYALSPIYEIITTRQPSHDSWYIFASNLLGFPEPSLREYATHTVNLEFAILIHVIRYQVFHIRTLSQLPLSNFSFLLNHLAKGSNFNVNVASTELRHEFCALWNQIVEVRDGLQEDPSRVAGLILKEIRNVYLALHPEVPDAHSAPTQPASPGSQEPSSYPKCKDSNHRSVSTPHIHNLSDFPPIGMLLPWESSVVLLSTPLFR